MTRRYTIAGVYPLKSEAARTASLIDLDQVQIERLLSRDLQNDDADDNWLEQARGVYQNGMHSGPYARLTLTAPLDRPVRLPLEPVQSVYANSINVLSDRSSHAVYELNVVGGTNDSYDTPIKGIVRTSQPERTFQTGTTTVLRVFYPAGSTCKVHDETETETETNTDECFAGPEGGLVLQGYGAVDYTYDPDTDNRFTASLKGYSEEEGLRMYYCEHHQGCGSYQEYQRFYDYYGILDYGNHWIEAAFASTSTEYSTELKLAHGNQDFSRLDDRSRNAAISTATITMNVFTMINRMMVEFAVDGCKKNANDFSSYGNAASMDSVIASWDTAAAIYAGSALISEEPQDHGVEDAKTTETTGSLYFRMVRDLADDFGVLEEFGEHGHHRSVLNRKVMEEFRLGKIGLAQADCHGQVQQSYTTILHAMRVPWIQGVLRAAFVTSSDDTVAAFDTNRRDDERGRGAAFLAALLPDLHHCSKDAAQRVYDELQTGRPDYGAVRDALEQQYECLGVTCDDVGGYLDSNSKRTGGTYNTYTYYQATRPCGGYGTKISQRRESVTYTNAAAVRASSSSFPGSRHTSGVVVVSTFFVALVAFCASLAVLIATVHDRANGRPMNVGRSARRVVAGAWSQVDYWWSRDTDGGSHHHRRHHRSEGVHDGESNYQVQLRSMPLPEGAFGNDNTNNNDSLL